MTRPLACRVIMSVFSLAALVSISATPAHADVVNFDDPTLDTASGIVSLDTIIPPYQEFTWTKFFRLCRDTRLPGLQ